jgi:stage V sporulation protein B
MQRSLLNAFVWTLFGKFGLQFSGLVVGALITRALGPSGRGVYAEMQTVVQMAVALLGFSLDTAIYHFANREKYPVSDAARLAMTLTLSVVVGVIAAAGMAVMCLLYPERVSQHATSNLPLMSAAVITTLLANNLTTLAQAAGRVRLAAVVSTVQGVVSLTVVLLAFLLHNIGVRLAFGVLVVSQVVSIFAALTGFVRTSGLSLEGVSAPLVRGFVGAGLKQHVGSVSLFVYSKLNLLIVFHFCGAEQTGFLATAWVLGFGFIGIFGSFQLALYPRVLHQKDDFLITIRSIRIGLYLGAVAMLPILVFSKYVLRAYGGAAFEEAATTLRIMTVAAWVLFLSSLMAPYLVKAGVFALGSACAVLIGIVSVAANFLLVRPFQADGAALATLISVAFGFALSLGLLRLTSGRSPLALFLPDFRAERAALPSLLATLHPRRLRRSEM